MYVQSISGKYLMRDINNYLKHCLWPEVFKRMNTVLATFAVLWIRIRMFMDTPDSDPSIFFTDSSINREKKVRKTLISTILWLLFDFLSIKTDVKVTVTSNKEKKFEKNLFFVGILPATDEKSRIRSQIRIRKYQNVTDLQHRTFV